MNTHTTRIVALLFASLLAGGLVLLAVAMAPRRSRRRALPMPAA